MTTWNLGDLFESVVDVVADREAVVAGDVRLTYAALDERANRLAHVLAAAGLGAGDTVGLALRNGHEYLEAMLAAFKLRALPVNVNYRYTAEELAYLFADADVAAILHEPEHDDVVAQASADLSRLRLRLARGATYEAALADSPTNRPDLERSGDDLYVIYTGGTTGNPKGVLWRHEDLFFAALGGGNPGGEEPTRPAEVAELAVTRRTRLLPASPFTHGTAHWTALAMLLSGGTVVVATGAPFSAASTWRLAAEERATVMVIVGDAFGRPLADALVELDDVGGLEELLVIVSGGAILSPVVRDDILARLPWIAVVDGYGTSETGGQGQMPIWAGQKGTPLPRFHVDEHTAVLDDAGRPAPPGSGLVGRLARRGHIPLGYHGDEARTAATFPVIDGERWSIPGDLARVESDGTITLLGRGASSINSGGEKVFPEEVESVLKGHPAVYDAVVVGAPDDRWGERVTALVQLRSGRAVGEDALVAHCREHLAAFKVPRRFVTVDVVQRRPSGKLDLRWAQELAAS